MNRIMERNNQNIATYDEEILSENIDFQHL